MTTTAIIEQRGDRHLVIAVDHESGTRAVIGRHTAKYRARQQADDYNRDRVIEEMRR